LKRRYTNDQQVHEKLKLYSSSREWNLSYNERGPYSVNNCPFIKDKKPWITSIDKDMENSNLFAC
jgi:hypothetical protein